eukprot:g72818.t1
MSEAPELKRWANAESWEENMIQMRADWKGSEEDLKSIQVLLQKLMAKEKEIFDPPRPGTVKHFEAHFRKIPGMNITNASRRSRLGRREESIAQEKAEELQADDFTEFSDSPISSHVLRQPQETRKSLHLQCQKIATGREQAYPLASSNEGHFGEHV